jgi:translation elongation factor P/translation initiation factor 5A
VHIEQIRAEIKPNNQFDKDMEFLQNDGKIYTTMDDEHFSIVTNT